MGLPTDVTFFPAVPPGTFVPSRGLGVGIGAHVYLFSVGPARVGVGVHVLRASGETDATTTVATSGSTSGSGSSSGSSSGSDSTLTAVRRPATTTSLRTIAPQISLNFGSADGWSYISAGVGRAQVHTEASEFVTGTGDETMTRPAASLRNPSLPSLNFGFGAKWFALERMAFSFDVRFHKLSLGSGEIVTPRTTLVAATAGVSLR